MTASAPIPVETLSHLIGAIYDCAIDPGRWPGTLGDIHQTLGFANAAMNVMTLPEGTSHLDITSGIDEPWRTQMLESTADVIEQWGGAERLMAYPIEEPAVLSWVSPRETWGSSRYYRDWAKPQGLIDVMAVVVARDTGLIGSIGFGRHGSMGEIGAREVDAARLLVPHLQRAVTIGKLLELRSLVGSAQHAVLDALSAGVVLVDDGLRVLDANRAGRTMLDAGDPIGLKAGRLALRHPLVTRSLEQAVRRAGESDASVGQRGLGIPATLADGRPCVLHVLPLAQGMVRPDLQPGAVAAVFVAPAKAPAQPDLLAALFDLTSAEARVFAGIASGRTPSEIARDLGIANTTVKTHLGRVFMKTGTRRQAELVKLAATVASPP